MFELCIVDPREITDDLPPAWNHLEHYEPGETRLIHYTVVPTQPWKNDKNPNKDLWERDFEAAHAAQVVHDDEIERLAKTGHIKRSLAGLPPAGRAGALLASVTARLKWAAQQAVQRYRVFQHPAVLRVRRRLGF
jgi:hypothetical protein